jgi:hypothetical protein
MILDEKETYQLRINKWKIGFNLLFISFFYYKMPLILYKRWQLDTLSAWSIVYMVLAVVMLLMTIRLVRILLSSGLSVEMSDAGIKTSTFGFNWKNIVDIKVTKDKVLLIYSDNADKFFESLKVSKFQRKIMEAYALKHGTPFAIQIGETNYKAVEFETALAKFRKKDPSV